MSARRSITIADLTHEDWGIWMARFAPDSIRYGVWFHSWEQDRRDADIMLNASFGRQIRIDHPGDESGDFSAVLFPNFWACMPT